jgi:hypothetical protein
MKVTCLYCQDECQQCERGCETRTFCHVGCQYGLLQLTGKRDKSEHDKGARSGAKKVGRKQKRQAEALKALEEAIGACKLNVDLRNCVVRLDNYAPRRLMAVNMLQQNMLFVVYNKEREEETMIKIQIDSMQQHKHATRSEVVIACVVGTLPNFARFLNAWRCALVPDVWRQPLRPLTTYDPVFPYESGTRIHPHIFSFMEMVRYRGTLDDLVKEETYGLRDLLSIFYELITALEVAEQAYDFSHNDIAMRNIFYEYREEPRLYVEGSVACRSRYYPVWADFGQSRINNFTAPFLPHAHTIDRRELIDVMEQLKSDFPTAYYDTVILPMKKDPYFFDTYAAMAAALVQVDPTQFA